MQALGLCNGHACPLPLTQRDLADSMGLSPVHVNRTLQQLRAVGLIQLSGRQLRVADLEALKSEGRFDPTYLHFRRVPA